MRLTQRKVNHVYFWESVAWALAVRFLISQPVICVHSQWVTAPIFLSLIAFSIMVQLWTILVCSLSFSSTILSWTFPSSLHLFMRGAMEPIPQIFRCLCISCQVCHLPPHTKSGQRARHRGTASHPVSLQHQHCQRCGHGKQILFQNVFVTAASPRPGCKQRLYFWRPHGLTLS